MSYDILHLILRRLDSIDHGLGEVEQHLRLVDQRLDRSEHRLDLIEREQTRLRTDLLEQTERVLVGVHTLREDMTVAMGFAGRAGACTDGTAVVQRAMENQITNLRTRIERLEPRQSGPS